MTLKFSDGFDRYDSIEQIKQRWNSLTRVTGVSVIADSPHNHGKSLFFPSATGDAGKCRLSFHWQKDFLDNYQSGLVGFHFKTSDLTTDVTEPIITFRSDGVFGIQNTVRHRSDGLLEVYEGNAILLESGGFLSTNTWHYLEIKYYTSDSIPADSYIVRLDGVEVINLPISSDTDSFGDGTTAAFELGGADGANRYYDNLYFLTTTGNFNNDFLGVTFIETISPTGDGSQGSFIGSDGDAINNFANMDETVTDEDSTYIQTGSSGDISVYKFSNPTGNVGTIHGLSLINRGRKTTTALGLARNVAKVSGTNYSQPQRFIHTSYEYIDNIVETNPETNGLWTLNEIAVNEFGVRFDR